MKAEEAKIVLSIAKKQQTDRIVYQAMEKACEALELLAEKELEEIRNND